MNDWLDEELDNSWAENIENTETIFNDFYKENIKNLKVYILFINDNNEIYDIDKLFFKSNIITYSDIVYLYKKYRHHNNKYYKLIDIFSYNFTINPENILNKNDFSLFSSEFLSSYKIQNGIDIIFKPSIKLFHNLNSAFLIFKNHNKLAHNKLAHNKLAHNKLAHNKLAHNNLSRGFKNNTKRVKINLKHVKKHTRRTNY